MAEGDDKRFFSMGARVLGIVALVIGAVVIVSAIVDSNSGISAWFVALTITLAGLVWVALLRQVIVLKPTTLVLHNMFDTVTIPLAAVEVVVVGQVTAIRANGKRYVSAAVGRSPRQQRRDAKKSDGSRQSMFGGLGALPVDSLKARDVDIAASAATYERLFESQVMARRDRLRGDRGVDPDAAVERRWAWPEIVLMTASVAVTVVLILVR